MPRAASRSAGSSPNPAESAAVLGGRRPGASAPHIRRVTRNYANDWLSHNGAAEAV